MEAELSSEVGAAGRLFKSCIDLYWALLQRTLPLEYKKQQKQALRTEFGRLYFWGDGFYPYDGRLDEILTVSSRLRNRVTSILVEIGGLLCHEKTGLYGLVGRVLVDDRLREQRQEVASLIESIRETLDDPVSSGSESDSGSDVSNEGNQLQDIITALRSRNQGLIDLSGSLERPAADADPPETTAADSVAFIVSGPAEIWTRKVIDTFPDLDTRFAERLGEANWQRYQRVARKLESAEPFDDESESDHEADMSDDDIGVLPHFTETTKSSADPSSIFSSAGRQTATTGTSITTTTFDYAFPMAPRVRMPKDLRSQATYTSLFTNDEGERGWLKIPALPKGAASGKAFRCTVCGDRQQEIINRMEWKRHVFADLEPYLCTFNDCKAGLASFKNRKAWADHEFAVHRVQKIWVCNDCAKEFDQRSLMLEHTYGSHGNVLMRNQLEALVNAAERSVGPAGNNGCPFCLETPATKPRGWAMHVGRHMEEIALAVLPRDFKFEEDKDSFSEHSVVSDGEERQDSEVPETEKKGIMRGIPLDGQL
ncbi:uncharacterized protein KY384_007515 [Bacidia gigantensis]|uniref:uncharacterized protein n=1 Tax=Bacidia gigantensis TaxID=2732470 RepID=UPI001D048EE6|nr:uncharacterized protein KY384_007515 [Bacidia gigantensis]KAG8527363.1 hypothetical protein KY384_007515 [Bacidia gigantensis]